MAGYRYQSEGERGSEALEMVKTVLKARLGDGAITLANLVQTERDSDQDSDHIERLFREIPISWAIRIIGAGDPRMEELKALSDWAYQRHERTAARLEAERDLPRIGDFSTLLPGEEAS